MDAPVLTPPSATPTADSGGPNREPERRSVGRALGRTSAVYAVCGLLNKAIGFVLLPLYTHLLSADQLGAVAVVVVVASFLTALFAMAMGTAVMRYYHEYRDRPEELAQFTGTVLTAVFGVSVLASAVLILCGESVFSWLLGDVPFWPLMAMGLGVALFQPFIEVYLHVLQTAERPKAYGVLALSLVLIKTGLAIGLVLGLGFRAEGVLGAHVAAAAAIFLVCCWSLRGTVRLGLRWDQLKKALRYSLPILPHTLASLVRQILDRLFLLHLVSVAAAGVYFVAFQFGTLTQILCASCSKALNPVMMRAMHERDHVRLANIRNLGTTLVLGYCTFSLGVSLFSPEVVVLLTGPEFHDTYRMVPFLAFAFAASGIYSLLVLTLFFWERTAKYVGMCTVASLGIAALLNWLLIPQFGMVGAAVAALVTQLCIVLAVGLIARPRTMVAWRYGRFAAMFTLAFAVSLWPLSPMHTLSWGGAALKLGLTAATIAALTTIAYGSPAFLLRELRRARISME